MKNLKKLIAVVLTFTLVFSAMAVGFAGTFSDVKDDAPYASAVARLQSLGLVSGMPDGTYQPDSAVTRAQMIAFVNAAQGLQDAAKLAVGPTKFKDVPATFWAAGDINIADPSGYPDGTFKPNNTVTYPEALALILRALGYTADYSWPYGVIAKATNVGITDGVTLSANATINRGQMAMLINNALDLNINKYVDGAESETDTKLITKVATPTDYVVLATANGATDVGTGKVLLYDLGSDKEVIKNAGDIDFTSYIGEAVTVYLTKSGVPVLVEEGTSDITNKVKEYDDATLDGNAVKDSDGNTTSVDLSKLDYVLFNGYLTNYSAIKSKLGTFDIKLINNDGNADNNADGYDYAVITDYAYSSSVVTDNVASGDKYIATDNGNYTLVDSDGDAYNVVVAGDVSKLTDIHENDVVYYGRQYNEDGDQVGVYVYVVRKTVEGKVEATYTDDGNYVTINGKDYKLVNGLTFDDVTKGDEGTFVLNADGDIVAFLGTTTATANYAVVLDSSYVGSKLSNKIELLTADGSDKIYTWDNTDNTIADPHNLAKGTLVKYDVNSAGTIVSDVYASSYDDITIEKISGGLFKKFDNDNDYVTINSTKYYLSDSTVIFNYDGSDYSVVKLSDISDIDGVKYIAYDDYKNVKAIIVDNATYESDNTTDIVAFVTNAYNVSTSDDKTYTRIKAIVNGEETTYNASKDLLSDLKVGNNVDCTAYKLTIDNDTNKVTKADKVTGTDNVVSGTVYQRDIKVSSATIKIGDTGYYKLAPGFTVVMQDGTGTDASYDVSNVADIPDGVTVTAYRDDAGKIAVIVFVKQ
ncbi:S-layer protein [Thermoanaerobacterium thermosaccharolyticum]|uniref:S-layer protein n=1 Tax=Thermoanaerobacterium thermosaccharolyticum TaxID=1517 RepID=A0A223HY01_THETR|nr:S-layer homology domain-containing protein [Thermoanaerobacterium thermosaccharolyticum]AST57257.1 S-layer protein [Thermoanaerobacterium thermosaccharolyticum]